MVFRLKLETCLLVLEKYGVFGGGPEFFFFLVPLGGVFRLKLETCLLVLEKYGVFGGGPKFFFFWFLWEGFLD